MFYWPQCRKSFFRQKVTGCNYERFSCYYRKYCFYRDDLDYNKYFYWDGTHLQKVSKCKIISIFNNIWGSRIQQLSVQYPEEYAAINKPLELKMSPEISERVKEVKNIASELQDSSFEDCLKKTTKMG